MNDYNFLVKLTDRPTSLYNQKPHRDTLHYKEPINYEKSVRGGEDEVANL